MSKNNTPKDTVSEETINEHILCSAVWLDDGIFHKEQPVNIKTGFIVCGRRHNDCLTVIENIINGNLDNFFSRFKKTDNFMTENMGFITSANRFVDRKEAFKIAKYKSQIVYGFKFETSEPDCLISENLY